MRESILRDAIPFLLTCLTTLGAAAVEKSVTISTDGYSGKAVTNFPLLVRLDATRLPNFYADARTDGSDIRFTAPDGMTTYPHEIDTWDTNGTSLVWVKLPILSRTTSFRLFYGSGTTEANSAAVWADYHGVWHLNPELTDSASGAHDLTAVNTGGVTNGAIGAAHAIRRTNAASPKEGALIVNDSVAMPLTNDFTISMWVRHAATFDSQEAYVAKTEGLWANIADDPDYKKPHGFIIVDCDEWNGRKINLSNGNDNLKQNLRVNNNGFDAHDEKWHALAFAWRGCGGAASEVRIYVDGKYTANVTGSGLNLSPSTRPLVFGNRSSRFPTENIGTTNSYGNAWNGSFDELRLARFLADDSWVAAEYAVATTDVCSFGPIIGPDGPEDPEPPSMTGRTLYVDAASTNAPLGTAEAPYVSLAAAFADCRDGDEIRIVGGEGRSYSLVTNLVASNASVRICGVGATDPVVFVRSADKFGIRLSSREGGCRISNLRFSINAGCLPESFVQLSGPDTVVENCEFALSGDYLGWISNEGYSVIDLSDAPGAVVRNCRFTNLRTSWADGHPCTLVKVHDGATLVGNVANNCGRMIHAKNNGTAPVSLVSNVVLNCARTEGALFASSWNTLQNVTVFGNVVRSTEPKPTGSAIELAGNYSGYRSGRSHFANNTFMNLACAIRFGLNGRYNRNGIVNNLFVGCPTNICDNTAGSSFIVKDPGFIRNNISVDSTVPLAARRDAFVLDGVPIVTDNRAWRGLALKFVNLRSPLSPDYCRPYCDDLTRALKRGGWTDDGNFPAYVGAKKPSVGPGFTVAIDGGGVSATSPADDGSDDPEEDEEPDTPEASEDPIRDDPETTAEAVGELGVARLGSGAFWRIVALDPTNVVLQADYTGVEHASFAMSKAERQLTGWKYDNAFNAAVACAQAHRPATEALLAEGPYAVNGKEVADFGLWKYPFALSRYTDNAGKPKAAYAAEMIYIVYVRLAKPLVAGETTTWRTPTGSSFRFTYRPDEVPTPLLKVNEVGYSPSQGKKFAYLGSWLGPKFGAYEPHAGQAFEIVDETSGAVVRSGMFVHRVDDRTKDGGCFLGEKTVEADLSDLSAPGRYYVRAPGVGRSETFPIGEDALGEAFAVHMKGLFHQRCGCEKTTNLTCWTDAACHTDVLRGIQSPNQWEYDCQFSDATGGVVQTTHFKVITANLRFLDEHLTLPGGWHDAADYDRRPMHLGVVNSLISAYMLRSENFSDSQLAVPERDNGIPDILDEADWGLRHLLGGQQADGGVGTWIETTEHPAPDDGVMPSADPHVYCLARATRESSLEYAGHAAYLARALLKCGTPAALERASVYRASAIAAWSYSRRPCPGPVEMRSGWDEKSEIVLRYQEPEDLDLNETVKAVVNLHALTGDATYLQTLDSAFVREFKSHTNQKRWSMSYDRHAEFLFTEIDNNCYKDLQDYWNVKCVKADADAMLLEEEGPDSFAYRMPWYTYRDWRVGNMSWGMCHPLRRAIAFCCTYSLTGDGKYLDAAYLANDFHNGCNANGINWTCGLGKHYPVTYLSIASVNDGIAEYVEGITPYRNTYGLPNDVKKLAWDWDDSPNGYGAWPFLRRYANIEERSVGVSEFTVTETIAPAVFTTGYLMTPTTKVPFRNRLPANDLRSLPGYWSLP